MKGLTLLEQFVFPELSFSIYGYEKDGVGGKGKHSRLTQNKSLTHSKAKETV